MTVSTCNNEHSHRSSARSVTYPVCLVEQQGSEGYCFALLPDLGCEAAGVDVDQAIAFVYRRALARLADWSGDPPTPSRLSLAHINLALCAPACPADVGELLVPDAAGGWSQRQDLMDDHR
jgi:hypothetical protein